MIKRSVTLFFGLSLVACGGGGFRAITPSSGARLPSTSNNALALPIRGNEANVLAVTVGCGYVNEPCVSVTICQPGTSTCKTIPNILVDTGSFGLRIFSSLVPFSLAAVTDSASHNPLGECASYAGGTSTWGPVKIADVKLGGELAPQVPVQLIDANFGHRPSDCDNPDTSPSDTGYNGILGVGVFTEDCGAVCGSVANNHLYFSCGTTSCTSVAVPIEKQVSNPVSFLPQDNNGVILQIPEVPPTGAVSVRGYLVLGIGTQANNTPPEGVKVFKTDGNGNFTTQFEGRTVSAFIDSGSNGYFFPSTTLTPCSSTGDVAGFYCPAATAHLSATQIASGGATSRAVAFDIINATSIATSPYYVYDNIGGAVTQDFDWGLPFFLGRTVYTGIENRGSMLGSGPYWAY